VNVPRMRCIHGRYFWRPTKAVKRLGFANVALGADLLKAVQEAGRLNDEVEKVRRGPMNVLVRSAAASPTSSRSIGPMMPSRG